jgi:hypothetical protein
LFYNGVDGPQGAKSMSWFNSFKTISVTQGLETAKKWNEPADAIKIMHLPTVGYYTDCGYRRDAIK